MLTISRRFVCGGERRTGGPADQRFLPRVELRGDAKQPVVVGYASVFYRAGDPATQYEILPDLVERIMPGAFDEAIKQDDVRGLVNHDPNQLVGRTKAKTCRLAIDAVGLRYEIDLPDTQAGRDLRVSLERGDMDGSSFSFTVWGARGKTVWSQETTDGKTVDVREIHACELYDVGPVTFPAYGGTTAGMRSQDLAEITDERDAIRSQAAATEAANSAELLSVEIAARAAEVGAAE